MSNVNQVVAKFRRRYPQCDEARARSIFDDAHREITARTRLREASISVSLTAGQRLYDFTHEALVVLAADYMSADGATPTPLAETSPDHLEIQNPGWRLSTLSGTPRQYFLQSNADNDGAKLQIGFDPIPSSTTSDGYPVVQVHCIREAALSGTETLPPQLLSDEVYLSLMCRDFAREADHEKFGFWKALAEEELGRNVRHVRDRLDRLDTRLTPDLHVNRVV
jgi:hypothetical protein